MKKSIIRGLIAATAIALQTNFINAQFIVVNNPPGNFLRTSPFNQSVGVGNFTAAVRPQSALHVNTNLSYDGKFIAALVNETQQEGSYTTHWNTDEVAPGVYFYTLRVDGVDWVKKAIKIR